MSLECLIRSARLDLIDAQFIAPAGVVVALTPRLVPFVVTVHRWDILEFPYRWPMARTATTFTLESARGIIAVGNEILSEVRRFTRRDSRIAVIPNAVDTERFRPDVECGSLRRMIGIPEDHRVILSVGRLIPRKSYEYLLQAMRSVLTRFEECTLLMVGEGHLRRNLETLGHTLGLRDRARFLGVAKETDLPLLYAMADVFVMPSLSEGHCVSILEAMSSGRPVVASSIAANRESITDGQEGILVPARNVPLLAEAILRLLRDDGLRKKLGMNSRKRALADFSWDRRVRRLLEFYETTLQS